MFSFWMNTSDASPIVSFGDRATLFRRCYPLVKSPPANYRNSDATAVNTNRALTYRCTNAIIARCIERVSISKNVLIQLRFTRPARRAREPIAAIDLAVC
jgi:hypothetical protein